MADLLDAQASDLAGETSESFGDDDVEDQVPARPIGGPIPGVTVDSDLTDMPNACAVPGYVDAFAAAFPGRGPAITAEHVGAAIGAFERGLVTPSRWDAYLTGDRTALTSCSP